MKSRLSDYFRFLCYRSVFVHIHIVYISVIHFYCCSKDHWVHSDLKDSIIDCRDIMYKANKSKINIYRIKLPSSNLKD